MNMETMSRTRGTNRLAALRAGRLVNRMLIWGGVTLGFVDNAVVRAQLPDLDWIEVRALAERPQGDQFTWDGIAPDNYFSTPVPFINNVPQSDSGVDWFNSVCLVRDSQGNHVGYAVAGYSYIPTFGYPGQCGNAVIEGFPSPGGFEDFNKRFGHNTVTVALFDLDGGDPLWYHTYMGGSAQGIIQDKDGNLVVVGECFADAPWPNTPHSLQTTYVNPQTGQPLVDWGTTACDANKSKMLVMKVDATTGNALWNHVYSVDDNPALYRHSRTMGFSIAEVDPDGSGGYRAVGTWTLPTDHPRYPVTKELPMMIDLDVNGMLNWKQVFDENHSTGLFQVGNAGGQGFWIERHPDPQQDKYVVTGLRYQNPLDNNGATTPHSAFLMYFTDNTQVPAWTRDTRIDATALGYTGTLKSLSNRAGFAIENGNTSLIWPVLEITVANWWALPNHQANSRVMRLDDQGNSLWNPVPDLGPMRGFDLRFDATQRASGHVAVSCTKSVVSTNGITWNDVPAASQSCILANYSYDPDGGGNQTPVDWVNQGIGAMGHWLSNSYMAELDLADGTVHWEGEWDADADFPTEMPPAPDCTNGNIRQRQCSFQIVEADDGGLVVCGNTGHNWEDGFLIKFKNECETDPALYTAFHALYPYDPSNVYTLTANTTWSSSMNVRGSVVVPAGVVLTINNGAVIGFADSRKIGYTTNIVVEVGGRLEVTGGATLTNIAPCGDGMWDGIKALGTQTGAQSQANQGYVYIDNATIENAFVGVLAANTDLYNPETAPATQRGALVRCLAGTVFRNNIYGVVLRAYNCGNPGGCTDDFTNTRFEGCTFETVGALNYPDKTPRIHLFATNYPKLRVLGCTFRGEPAPGGNNVQAWGVGIRSHNTDMRILDLIGTWSNFFSLAEGCFSTYANTKPFRMNGANFVGCGHGVGVVAAGSAFITNTDHKHPDLDMTGQPDMYGNNYTAPVFGSYVDGVPVITFDYNAFYGDQNPYTNPCVGSTFRNIGDAVNRFFDNKWDGFRGPAGPVYSAGTTMQGDNDGPNFGDGLNFKCNQYSSGSINDFDIAFTGPSVSVGDRQGGNIDATSPAGNTFLLTCFGNDEHMVVDDVPNNPNLYFQYWHHAATAGVQVIPTCTTDPPLDPTPFIGINQPTNFLFNRVDACPGSQLLLGGGDLANKAASAASEHAAVKAAYDDWTDGGNTDGLEDFVQDPTKTSYQIKQQLMSVAPSVSSKVWGLVFERNPQLNPWHMAQALIANSPLEPEVYGMMEHSGLDPYYRQLVANEQGGMNMQTIMESELAHWDREKCLAVAAYTALAYEDGSGVSIADALAMQAQYPSEGGAQQVLQLHLANADPASARVHLNTMLAAQHTVWWDVQDMHLALLESGLEMEEVNAAQIALLETYASSGELGAASAQAWLAGLGTPYPMEVILPSDLRAASMGNNTATTLGMQQFIAVHPNPTSQEAWLTYHLPEGAETGRLEVMDALGRRILERPLPGNSGLLEVPAEFLQAGLYQVVLRADGVRIASVKFTAVR